MCNCLENEQSPSIYIWHFAVSGALSIVDFALLFKVSLLWNYNKQQSSDLFHTESFRNVFLLYPSHNEVVVGYIGFTLSVRSKTSVCPSHVPCPLCSAYGSSQIHFIFTYLIKQLRKVCGLLRFLQNYKFAFLAIFSCDQAALQVVFSVCPSVCPSVRLSVTPFWLCSHHRIIMKFSGFMTNDQSKVHAKGQGQRSKVKITEVTTHLNRFRTVTLVWFDIWWWNDAYSLMLLWRGVLLFFKVIHQISRSHGSKNRRIWPKLGVSGL